MIYWVKCAGACNLTVVGQIIQRCHLVAERKYCTLCVSGFIWKHYQIPQICNNSFSKSIGHVDLTFLTGSDWVTDVCLIKSFVLVSKAVILIFRSIFDCHEYALAFFFHSWLCPFCSSPNLCTPYSSIL